MCQVKMLTALLGLSLSLRVSLHLLSLEDIPHTNLEADDYKLLDIKHADSFHCLIKLLDIDHVQERQ